MINDERQIKKYHEKHLLINMQFDNILLDLEIKQKKQ